VAVDTSRISEGVVWSGVIAGAAIILGSLLPWARVAIFSVPGADGDGSITMVIRLNVSLLMLSAVVAVVLVLPRVSLAAL
jgi:hypothetical protein